MSIIDEAYQLALTTLQDCCKAGVFFASAWTPKNPGYNSLWIRDFSHTLFGIIAAEQLDNFKQPILNSIDSIFSQQFPSGQIPNNIDFWSDRQKKTFCGTVDSNPLFLLAISLLPLEWHIQQKYKQQLDKAYNWLIERDTSFHYLIEQQETTDWLDTIPNQGNVLSTNVLFYLVSKAYKKEDIAEKTLFNLREKFTDTTLGYVLPWVWKVDQGTYCDSFGNCLALLVHLLPQEKADMVLSYLEKNCASLYPARCLMPPIHPHNRWWRNAIEMSGSKTPFDYQNGGIWPFVGGWYITALIAHKRFEQAEIQLEKLAEANIKDPLFLFPEYLHGETGKPSGALKQAWSAGMYLAAYASVINKKTFMHHLID